MAIRVLLLLLSLVIIVNIVIIICSYIFGVNLYQKHGKQILNGFGILVLLIVIIYIVLSILGLV
ncbi:unknown [Brachyspira sp. CAG:484]|nr:unknown [Brachyspira sp. CAG:484]